VRPTLFPPHVGRILLASALLFLGAHPAAAQATSPQEELWDAAMRGDTVSMATALSHGATVDSLDTRRNPNGRRALNWAAWYNQPLAIRLLVSRGARVNSTNLTGFTPLHHAAESGSVEAAQALLELGADWNQLNGDGLRPIDVARAKGRFEIMVILDALPTK
jgi:ankyrin repeat protein